METFGLTALITKICTGTYTSTELVQFVNLIQKAALSYLRYQEVSGKRIALGRQDAQEELEDLALDCVADLFMRDENGAFVQLQKYFGDKLEELGENDAEMMLQVRRLVVKKTKQELSRIFRERDPEGAKVVRNIKVAVRTAKDLVCFREMGREFICFSRNGFKSEAPRDQCRLDQERLRRDCPPYPEEVLRNHFYSVNDANDSVSTSIRKLLSLIQEDEAHQNFLSVEIIARIIRSVRSEMFRENVGGRDSDTTPIEHLELKEIDEAKQQVLSEIKRKVECTYLDGGKLEQQKAVIYCEALVDVLDDLVNDRKPDSYYHLLKDRMPTLTQRQYRREERTVFEYLAKVAKREFRRKLRAML